MKREDFFEVLGGLDDELVGGAKERGRRKTAWKSWAALAACLALAAVLGVHGLHTTAPGQSGPALQDGGVKTQQDARPAPEDGGAEEAGGAPAAPGDEAVPGGTASPGGRTKKEAGQNALQELKGRREEQSGKYAPLSQSAAPGGDVNGGTAPAQGTDVPVTEHPGSTGALIPLDGVWGGSYMDQSGCWVVWLTENTPENQARVLERNPGLGADHTVFRTADYSLAFLTELMAKISGEMGAKRLPFVTTAALREDVNRVEVTMTTQDEGCAAQVLRLDTIGGAITFRYAAPIADRAVQKGPASDESNAPDGGDAAIEIE